jgi:Phage DNA packaging protein Nu1
MLVNKVELAKLLGCSRPTIEAYLDRYGDEFPVVTRGRNGKSWIFNSEDVITFLAVKEADRRQTQERRQEEMANQAERALPFIARRDPAISTSDAVRVMRDAIEASDLRLRAGLHRIALENPGADQILRQVEDAIHGWQRELRQDIDRRLREMSPD